MIRRINRSTDLKDYIKSCPSGVVDDIYKIEYYIQGYNTAIECSFTKVGETLEVILPTSQLQFLPNGILMRRAYYRVYDSSFPDSYYDLEFEDCMNVWLGDNEENVRTDYVTESELSSTLSSYATLSWVSSQGYLTASTLPSDIATQSWVSSNAMVYDRSISEFGSCVNYSDGQIKFLRPDLRPGYEGGYIGVYIGDENSEDGFAGLIECFSGGYTCDRFLTNADTSDFLATQYWTTSNFLSQGAVWTGTQSAWEQLTSSQRATYIIALITD